MTDTYTYRFEKNLYINLTNRCSNACTFCLRNNGDGIGGNHLWLKKEPSFEDVIESIEGSDEFEEAVFCGYGESTYRLNELIEIATYLKKKGHKTRLDTNGHGNLINGFDITPLIAPVIDTVSISLNHSSKEKYDQIAKPIYPDAYQKMKEFAQKCVQNGIKTIMSVVDVIDPADIEACRQIATKLGATLRVREYIN